MRVTFQHGKDPQFGDKIIASIREVREDDEGAYYETPLVEGLPPLTSTAFGPACTARHSASCSGRRNSTGARADQITTQRTTRADDPRR
jgi:hypothetical protein